METKTHAIGLRHPNLKGLVYLKDGRSSLGEKRKPAVKQPLVIDPRISSVPGFVSLRVAAFGPNTDYMNSNMSAFASRGGSPVGMALDIPDAAALDELLRVMGLAPSEPPTVEEDIAGAIDLPGDATERQAVIAARRGQGRFRTELVRLWGGCAVTGCSNPALLRASHIKPWRDSNNRERLSPDNGLLLSAHFDAAFDRGLISFTDEGRLLIHDRLSDSDAKALGINTDLRLLLVRREHQPNLAAHRRMHGFP